MHGMVAGNTLPGHSQARQSELAWLCSALARLKQSSTAEQQIPRNACQHRGKVEMQEPPGNGIPQSTMAGITLLGGCQGGHSFGAALAAQLTSLPFPRSLRDEPRYEII